MTFKIREVQLSDAGELLRVYAPFVTDTCISFEYEVPTLENFTQRIVDISADYPYLVLEKDGEVVGYAYAHRYLARAAYDWDAELTIYMAPAAQGKGVGVILENAVEELLVLQNVKNLYGCITGANEHSVGMHTAMGYEPAGTFYNAGFKHGKWLDVIWMQKFLGKCEGTPASFVRFPDLDRQAVAEVLARANDKLRLK